MKKTLKRLGAAFLAGALVAAMAVPAMAATTLKTNGEQGAFANPDEAVTQNKTLILEKELKVYNLDETKVNGPTITYKYAITPATVTAGTTVTDKADKHDPAGSVTAPVKAGIGNLTATVSWTNDELDADTNGVKNVKDISLDFSSIVFGSAGVFRYEINESLDTGFTYDNTGVTETTGAHKRFVDVYVRPATTFSDGTAATDWDIYGFTCFYNNKTITDDDKTTEAVKTTGFVSGTTDGTAGTAFLADQYYTYNLTISKTVENDNYAKATHEFPFTVIFTNSDIAKNILLKTTVSAGKATDFTHAAGAPTWSGIAKLKDSGSIKYIGIPMGTDVEVYETNDMTGATYQVTTTRTNATTATGTDNSVVSGATPAAAVSQTTKKDCESTKSVIDTTKNGDDDATHSIAITNKLLLISPTGVALRFAPYVLMLVAGLAILLVGHKRREED